MFNPKLIIKAFFFLIILNHSVNSFATSVPLNQDSELALSNPSNTINPQPIVLNTNLPAVEHNTERSPLFSSAAQLDQILFYLDDDTKLHHVNRYLFKAITGFGHRYILKKGFVYFDSYAKRVPSKIPYKRIDFAKIHSKSIPTYILYSHINQADSISVEDYSHLEFMNVHILNLSRPKTKNYKSSSYYTMHNLIVPFHEKKISDREILTLVKALKKTQINELYLSNNSIAMIGFYYLIKALELARVQTLNLDQNNIHDIGVRYVSKFLSRTYLNNLSLANNQLTYASLYHLAQVLPNTQIHTLNLEGNNICDIGADYIIDVLPKTKIKKLDLRCNKLSDRIKEQLRSQFPQIIFEL